ncbi:MAG: ribosome maturation factor RimP [Clostridia bacterium]|nr:ribosome maturation factor RimP [Clostridia bacterium]
MAKGPKNIAEYVCRAITPGVSALGYDIWDVEYVKEGSEWYLRITVDSPEGIDIDDCEKAYRVIDAVIDEIDPIEGSYHLEVSSPGVERDLRTAEHFQWALGQVIVLKLFAAIDGKKELIGILEEIDEKGTLTLQCEEKSYSVERQKISRAHLYFDFDAQGIEED